MSTDALATFLADLDLEPAAATRLAQAAMLTRLPAGSVAFRPGTACEAYVFVLSGRVRVQMVSDTGREIVLYRVAEREGCILTTACLLADLEYAAEAVAETDVTVVLVPRPVFQALLAQSAAFRRFVFRGFAQRLRDLLLVVEEVAFRRVDLRLSRFLVDHAGPDRSLRLSHHELAAELGTVREVVSRQLKEFERRGWVALARGRIELRDVASLRRLLQRAS